MQVIHFFFLALHLLRCYDFTTKDRRSFPALSSSLVFFPPSLPFPSLYSLTFHLNFATQRAKILPSLLLPLLTQKSHAIPSSPHVRHPFPHPFLLLKHSACLPWDPSFNQVDAFSVLPCQLPPFSSTVASLFNYFSVFFFKIL